MKYSLIGVLAAAAGIAIAQPDASALSLVKQAIERDAKTAYTCIRVLMAWSAEEPIRIRRDQAANGANRIVVLAPLSKQGYTIVDNCKQWVTYDPDRQRLTVQDSPLLRVSALDTDRRYELLKRNYQVLKEGRDTVAGRPTVRVRLKPDASKALFERRYWIDVKKHVLLRVEWIDPSGERRIVSDTLSIGFVDSFPPDTFAAKFVGEPREIRIQAPVRQRCISSLSKGVGFGVINPVRMPFGFLFTGADAIKGESRTMAALRYTDGAANVTIYQVLGRSPTGSGRRHRGRSFFEVGALRVAVEGDLPGSGVEAIAAALRESSAAREAELRERAAAMFQAGIVTVGRLRDSGLGFDEVVACLAAGQSDSRSLAIAQRLFLGGRGLSVVAREMRLKEADLKAALERFWAPRT